MRQLIGIVGFKSSGKDTAGKFLTDQKGFSKYSFAGPLKKVVAASFQWSEDLMEGDTKESRDWREQPDLWWEKKLEWKTLEWSKFYPRFTPRVAMQLIGSDVMRRYVHDDLWLLGFEKFFEENTQDIVVTDCRFIHEIKKILSLNGKLLRIRRGDDPDWVERAPLMNPKEWEDFKKEMFEMRVHASEYEWARFQIKSVIDNNDSVSALWENVEEFVNREHE